MTKKKKKKMISSFYKSLIAAFILVPLVLIGHEHTKLSPEIQKIDSFIINQINQDEILGAELIIMQADTLLFHKSYGWNDKQDSIKMELNTVFNIRSMTKMFTTVVVNQLIEEGKLSLSDKVNKYLNGFVSPRASSITISQLLLHKSGLPISIIKSFDDYNTLIELATQIGQSDNILEPDEFLYSDAGYDVLGAIIETICQKSLEKVFKERIFDKLEMEQTFSIIKESKKGLKNVASLYGGSKGHWQRFWSPKDEFFYKFTMGSQSYYCTPADYTKFMSLIINDGKYKSEQIITEKALKRILDPVTEYKLPVYDMPYKNGFGDFKTYMGQTVLIFTSDRANPIIIGSGGSDGTFTWAFKEKNLIVSYFTQSRKSDAFPMKSMEEVLNKLFIDQDESIKKEISTNTKYAKYTGTYSTDLKPFDQGEFKISDINNTLSVFIPGQMDFELNNPIQGEWSFKISPLVSVQFEEKEGCVIGFYLNQKVKFSKVIDSTFQSTFNENDFRNIIGEYKMPQYNMNSTIEYIDGIFYLELVKGVKSEIQISNNETYWSYKNDKNKRIMFLHDDKGIINGMYVTSRIYVSKD